MVRRKIQRFEIVVVGFDDWTFSDRIAQLLENAYDLMHRAHDRMLGADGAADAGEGDTRRRGRRRP